jgi:Iap family predicted aminopeptidase
MTTDPSHNTPGFRILCDDWGDEILIHHNHYMTSFLDNLALVAMAVQVAYKHCVRIDKSIIVFNGVVEASILFQMTEFRKLVRGE